MTSRKRKDDIDMDDNEYGASTTSTQIGHASASTTARAADGDDSSAEGLLPEELVIDGDDDDNVKLNQNLITNSP
jgi:hypothetical protein